MLRRASHAGSPQVGTLQSVLTPEGPSGASRVEQARSRQERVRAAVGKRCCALTVTGGQSHAVIRPRP